MAIEITPYTDPSQPNPGRRNRVRNGKLGAAGLANAVVGQTSKIISQPTAPQVAGKELTPAMRTGFVERHGKLAELDRSFDLKFWQDQPSQARFDAAWELIAHAHRIRGGDVRQLRLQRSIESFQRQPG